MKLKIYFILFVLVLSACVPASQAGPAKAELPAGKGYADNQIIYFIHTETSDAKISETLTKMMSSPVLFVPSLSSVPEEALANVYVFANGIAGSGPLGFQSDVFDNPPGTDGYTPLRKLNVVSWNNPGESIEVKSASDLVTLQEQGKIKIDQPGIVINMPFILWKDGKR